MVAFPSPLLFPVSPLCYFSCFPFPFLSPSCLSFIFFVFIVFMPKTVFLIFTSHRILFFTFLYSSRCFTLFFPSFITHSNCRFVFFVSLYNLFRSSLLMFFFHPHSYKSTLHIFFSLNHSNRRFIFFPFFVSSLQIPLIS